MQLGCSSDLSCHRDLITHQTCSHLSYNLGSCCRVVSAAGLHLRQSVFLIAHIENVWMLPGDS
jgi:hypothetical protein